VPSARLYLGQVPRAAAGDRVPRARRCSCVVDATQASRDRSRAPGCSRSRHEGLHGDVHCNGFSKPLDQDWEPGSAARGDWFVGEPPRGGCVKPMPNTSAARSFDITTVGDTTFTSYTLSTIATTHSRLDTDLVNGIQIRLESCSNSWTETGSSPNFSYTRSGTTTVLIANKPRLRPRPARRDHAAHAEAPHGLVRQ
jgi:hypothetical protein